MKSFVQSILIFLLLSIPGKASIFQFTQDTILSSVKNYQYYDSLIQLNDRQGNYGRALEAAKSGLELSIIEPNEAKQSLYHLKLSKFYYLLNRPDDALTHIRLYSLLKTSEIQKNKNNEIFELEEAYLDEINRITLEMNMDKTLIQNLQEENERYYSGQKYIRTALKIGIGALVLVISIIVYNKTRSRKDKANASRKGKEELEQLREQVDKYETELMRASKDISRFKSMQKHNIAYARSIQLSLLPSGLDLTDKIRDSFVLYLPKESISGDFYTVYSNGGKTVLAVFDCPGHGVNAAHSTVVTHNLFKDIVSQGITAPSMVLTMMDQKLKRETKQLEEDKEIMSGVKMAVCTINQKTKEVEYAGANFPLFYVHLDELHFVKGNHFPIGDTLFSDKFYSSSNLRLSTGDMIYLSTDGYYSQIGGKKNKKFLRSSLVNLLKSIFNHEIKEQQFILEKVFHEWKAREEQTDDVLIMGFRI